MEARESSEPTKLEFKEAIVWRSPSIPDSYNMDAAGELAAKTGKLAILLGPGESIESLDQDQMREAGWMPVSEAERLHAQLADLREAARAVLETLDRSSSFSVDQVDALRAALGQKERNDE